MVTKHIFLIGIVLLALVVSGANLDIKQYFASVDDDADALVSYICNHNILNIYISLFFFSICRSLLCLIMSQKGT